MTTAANGRAEFGGPDVLLMRAAAVLVCMRVRVVVGLLLCAEDKGWWMMSLVGEKRVLRVAATQSWVGSYKRRRRCEYKCWRRRRRNGNGNGRRLLIPRWQQARADGTIDWKHKPRNRR
jgi:hypothetical protein